MCVPRDRFLANWGLLAPPERTDFLLGQVSLVRRHSAAPCRPVQVTRATVRVETGSPVMGATPDAGADPPL